MGLAEIPAAVRDPCAALLFDYERVLGHLHPYTVNVRHHLVYCRQRVN
jgi:hypothetical protein